MFATHCSGGALLTFIIGIAIHLFFAVFLGCLFRQTTVGVPVFRPICAEPICQPAGCSQFGLQRHQRSCFRVVPEVTY